MPRESIGEFEQLVMLAVLRLGDEAYAVSILREIRRHARRTVLRPAVYVALGRLEEKGLVAPRLGDASAERGGRARKYFRVTGEGRERLRESREVLLAMWEGLQGALGEP